MKILWYLKILYSYRLLKLKLKENEDMYVTNTNGKLRLKPLLDDRDTQHVSIHKRKLFFGTNNELYNLSLDTDNLEIKLKKEKTVVYLKRPKRNGKRSDPFGFKNKKLRSNNEETPREKLSKARMDSKPQDRNNNEQRNVNDPRNLNDFRNVHEPRNLQESRNSGMNIQSRPKMPLKDDMGKKDDVNDIDEQNLTKHSDDKEDEIADDKTPNIDMNSILNKVKHLLNEKKNYLIESDSKIEEDTVKYTKIDIFIHPLDDKYIKLKTKEKDCVTFFKDSFLFTPCLNVDNQVFKLEKEDDVIKKKSKSSYDDDEITSSTTTYVPKKKEVEVIQTKYKVSDDSNKNYYDPNNYEEELAYLRNRNRNSKFNSIPKYDFNSNGNLNKRSSDLTDNLTKNFKHNLGSSLTKNFNDNLNNNLNSNLTKNFNDNLKKNLNDNINNNLNNNLISNLTSNIRHIDMPDTTSRITHSVYEQTSIPKPQITVPKPPSINYFSKPPPPVEKPKENVNSLLESDSSLSKIMTPDDFLQKIKKSVDIPDFDGLM